MHEHGVSTFILVADDPFTIERFAEVAAELRAAVGEREERVRGRSAREGGRLAS